MVLRGDGALFFTIGGSGRFPIASHASSGISMAALRMYGRSLNKELAEAGIYVGVMTIAGPVRPGSEIDPDRIAELWWDMYVGGDRDAEDVGICCRRARPLHAHALNP